MSWINSSNSGRLGANNSNTATTNNMIQTSPATFGQQQWSPPHNKQQFLQNQPPPPSSTSFSNQSTNSNWFNSATTNTLESSNLSQPPPPQQQPFGLHQQQNFFSHSSQQPTVPTQPPQQINNSSLFLKSQQQQPQQQLDNQIYQQQQQYYPGQFQNQLPFNQQQNQNSTLNATPPPTSRLVASQNFIKSEQQMTSSTNIQQQQQQQPQQQNLVVANNNNDTFGNNQATDGWGDWGDDWGDNNNQVPIQNQSLIEESFKTESNDNWQWNDGIDQKPVMSNFQDNQQQQKLEKKPEITNHSTTLQQQQQRENGPEITPPFSTSSIKPQSNIEDQPTKSVANAFLQDVQSSPPSGIFNQPHTFIQTSRQNPVQQTVHSSPVMSPQQLQQKNLQAHHQDLTIENSDFQKHQQQQQQQQQQNALASAVYVSQAKPVSQPARQYAMTPSSSSTNSITNSLPLAQSTSSVAITPTSSRKDSLPKTQIPHPGSSQSPGVGGLPPPPPSQTPPDQQQNSNFNSSSSFPPPPPLINQTDAGAGTPNTSSISSNPYKRTGQAQHHRSFIAAPPKSQPQVPVMPSQFFAPPPPPEDFRNSIVPPSSKSDFQQNQSEEQNLGINQECLSSAPDNSEIVDRNFEVENFEVAPHTPNDDRNQYLQTSHLSEDGFNSSNNRQNSNMHQEINFENDSFPPPGLSRFVLGEPEAESQQNSASSQIDVPIPPGLDRMIPGTELNNSDLNMERQADGQDTIPSPTNAFTNVPPVEEPESSNLDITTDRNLYLVPGESDIHEQRVVTGLENGSSSQNTVQRDVEMEGENLEDQQQQQQQLHQQQQQQQHHDMVDMSREEPIEGANTLDAVIGGNHSLNHETESSLTMDTNLKDHSNVSTGNDESDHRDRQISYFSKTQRRVAEEKMKKKIGATGGNEQSHNDKRKGRYETEDSDLSSDRERRRYREGSARNDRDKERDSRERDRKDKREGSVRDTDRDRYKEDKENRRYDNDRNRNRDKYDKEKGDRGSSRYGVARYETDSKYETESSVRYDRRRGDRDRDRFDRDRDRGDNDYRKSEEKDRRYHRKDERNSREREYEREKGDTIRRRGRGGEVDDNRDYRQHRHHRDRDDRRDRRRDRDRDRERDRDYRDDRDKRDGRSGVGDDDYARKGGSRNARDGERDKDRLRSDRSDRDKDPSRYPSSQMYGYSSGYGYDPYRFYQQQQQYYEQLRRTNPQAYAEWYRKYYAGHHQSVQSDLGVIAPSVAGTTVTNLGGTTADGRESVHSGRSSTNDKQERPDNQTLNLIDTSITTTTALANTEPQRLTPCKFINEHSIANLSSAGIMVCIKPKYSQNNFGITNIVKILKIGSNDSIRRLYQQFPGPLVHGLTHKKTIIEFCEDQIRLGPQSSTINSRQNSSNSLNSLIQQQINKASFTLMWNLLILLLRQNGMVVGTDIAELLMKNKQQFPYENSLQKSSNTNNKLQRKNKSKGTLSDDDERSDNNEDNDGGDVDNNDNDENDDSNSNNSINNSRDGQQNSDESVSKVSLNEEVITEKFRNYLLYGNVNEALEWATDNNLWGHALFLASKVDRRLHANVMMKFANKLSLNDPLQTLYQMMSGRTPSSVTSVQDEKWGDWRPHLAMILSNTSQRPDLDRKSITTLGDSLYNRGDLFGAQFCYLMAQVGFGKYSSVNRDSILIPNSSSAVRLILLGSSQHKPFKEFATNEAIMMTEIYEYACTLNDDKFSIAEFQPYKYLLATRMLDYGLQLKTLMYMEQISLHIQRDPSKYDPTFIEKVFNLAERLKFYDPVLEKTMDDQQNVEQIQDQKWLQDLKDVIKNYCTGNNLLNESMMVGENNGQQQQQQITNSLENTDRSQIDQQYKEINQQFMEINQQFSELNMQYNNFDPIQQQQQQQQTSTQQQQQFNQIPQQQQQSEQDYHSLNSQSLTNTDQYGTNQNQYYGPSSLPNLQQDYNSLQSQNSYNNGMMSLGNIPQHEIYDQQNQNFQTDDQLQQQQQTMTPSYDYWNQQQQQQQQQNEFQTPQISMPNSMSNKSGFYDDTTVNDERMQNSQMTSAKNNNISSGDLNKNKQTTTSTNSKTDNKNLNKNGNQSNTNSGWFGGIWNKLSLKPKNQMILPDDKNPTIVWDPEKKKWVNKDGEETEQEGFKPPPKMSDIMPTIPTAPTSNQQSITPGNYGNSNQQQIPPTNYGSIPQVQQQQVQQMPTVPLMNPSSVPQQQQQQQQMQPVNATKTPNLQSNMFKMQRNRTLKKSYVDVFNPSGAAPKPTESVLAPTLPPVNVPQSGFFIPAPIDDTQQSQQVQQPQQQQVQDNVPQFYDPNQFAGY